MSDIESRPVNPRLQGNVHLTNTEVREVDYPVFVNRNGYFMTEVGEGNIVTKEFESSHAMSPRQEVEKAIKAAVGIAE